MAGSKQVPASSLTAQNSAALEELGGVREEADGKSYRYVKCTKGTVRKGSACGFITSNNNEVTASTNATDPEDRPAGIGIGSIECGNFGWIQRKGYNAYVKTDGGIAANGKGYKMSDAAKKITNDADAVTHIGIAVGADSGTFQVAGFWVDAL